MARVSSVHKTDGIVKTTIILGCGNGTAVRSPTKRTVVVSAGATVLKVVQVLLVYVNEPGWTALVR